MKPDPVEQELREVAWRRPLNAAEQARLEVWLQRHPQARADWEADAALNAALSRLPQKPAPSNLAARVLAEIDHSQSRSPVTRRRSLLARFGWLPRLTVAVVILWGGLFWYQQHRASRQTDALARLANVTDPGGMPSAEALENFEVILKIHPAPLADTELLAMSKRLAEFKP